MKRTYQENHRIPGGPTLVVTFKITGKPPLWQRIRHWVLLRLGLPTPPMAYTATPVSAEVRPARTPEED